MGGVIQRDECDNHFLINENGSYAVDRDRIRRDTGRTA